MFFSTPRDRAITSGGQTLVTETVERRYLSEGLNNVLNLDRGKKKTWKKEKLRDIEISHEVE